MPSTTDFSDFCAGTLASRLLTAATSGAVVTAQDINGSPITWPTGAHRLKFVSKTRTGTSVETIGVASASQSGSTVTLGTLTRQLSLTDGSTFTTGGSGYTFPANTKVYLTWDVFDAERTMKDDKVNTLTGAGAIRSASTTTPVVRLNNVTTAQRNAMTPANGDLVYDTDLGVNYQYVGGAWVAVGDAGTSNASTTEAGKVEEATVAELGAGTAAGGTGARLFINPSSAVKTSSGAGDENKIPLLGSSGTIAPGFLGTGTPTASKYLLGDGSWGTILSDRVRFFPDDAQRKSAGASTLLPSYDGTAAGTSTNTVHTHAFTNNGNYVALGFFIASGSDLVSSVTYNGVAMTRAESYINTPTGESNFLYVLPSASSGTNNFVITTSSSVALTWAATSYYWVSSDSSIALYNKGTGSGSASAAVTTTVDNSWIVGWGRAAGGTASAGANTTKRGATAEYGMFDTNGPETPVGSYSLACSGTGTNTMIVSAMAPIYYIETLDFDASTDEYADFVFTLPPSYAGGTVNIKINWVATATSGSAVFTAKAAAWGDGDMLTDSFGTTVTVTDAITTSRSNVATLPALTISGSPVSGDYVFLRIARDADNGADTLAVDARVLAIELTF